jgi:probable rRNA maturation factor
VTVEIEIGGSDEVERFTRAAQAALVAAGVDDGHVAIEFVDSDRIQELNLEFRGKDSATDVLSFPVDSTGPSVGPRELGDVVISPADTEDLDEAVVHGVLHLCGYDHEGDTGEMLDLQDRVMARLA